VLAIVLAAGGIYLLRYVRGNSAGFGRDNSSANAGHGDDDDDDPNQIDTIALGDPADAPVPAHKGDHVSPVHPTILVRLPHFGPGTGMIPNSPAGQLLYDWLAAFNKASAPMLRSALPSAAPGPAIAAQLALRSQTGGFNLLSAKEVQPGVLVFRLRDQTPASTEVLGTLQMLPDSNPPAIATFSLRAVAPARTDTNTAAPSPGSPR
jgi:hypothetical protein